MDENRVAEAVALKAAIDKQRQMIDWLSLKDVNLACHREGVFYPIIHSNAAAIIGAAKNQAQNALVKMLAELKAI